MSAPMPTTSCVGEVGSTVSYARVGGIATVTLSRPERRNAVSWELVHDLDRALSAAAGDDEARCVVLTGEGSDFCVGADLAASPQTRTLRGDTPAHDVRRLRQATDVLRRFHQFEKPTVAAVNGACAGAGLSLALAADFRIADQRAVFTTAFVRAGLSGDFGSAWLLSRAVGPAVAKSLLLLPEKIDAAEAARIGLVHSSVDDLAVEVERIASRLAETAPIAVRNAKANLNAAHGTLEEYLPGEVSRMVESFHTRDATEAAKAFLDKRPPTFTDC